MEISDDLILKLEKRTTVSSESFWNGTPCLEWTGSIKNNGYGQILNGKTPLYTHRLSWIINNGDIPNGLYVLHHCDNRKCCNIKHLFLGTAKENFDDMVSKNRRIWVRGDGHASSKLTEMEVVEILRLYKTGKYTQEQLSDMYGVERSRISDIYTGRSWKHIERP
jgi:hypothetical protein